MRFALLFLFALPALTFCGEVELAFERELRAQFDRAVLEADRIAVARIRDVPATENSPRRTEVVTLWEDRRVEERERLAHSVSIRVPPPHWVVKDGTKQMRSSRVSALPAFRVSLLRKDTPLMSLYFYPDYIGFEHDGVCELVGVDRLALADYYATMAKRIRATTANQPAPAQRP